MKRNIVNIIILLCTTVMSGCKKSPFDSDTNSTDNLNVRVMTKSIIGNQVGGTVGSDAVTVSDIRLIVLDDNKIIFNKSTKSGLTEEGGTSNNESEFTLKLKAGYYTICAVANETSQMQAQLTAVSNRSDLESIKISGSFTESNIPLYKEYQVVVYGSPDGSTNATVSTDGGATRNPKLNIDLERTQTKVSLMLRKQTGNSVEIAVQKVEIYNTPKDSYLIQRSYIAGGHQTLTPISGVNISLGADAVDENYVSIFETNNIFSEKYQNTSTDNTQAVYLKIYATFAGINTTYEVKIDETSGNYNLLRNVHYVIQGTVTNSGKLDATSITVHPREWDNINSDANINGNRVLNISRIEAMVHGSSITRVHFWSNQPFVWVDNGQMFQSRSDDPRIIDVSKPWKNGDANVSVNEIFKNLAINDPLDTPSIPGNFNYDRTTGKGYFDLENVNASSTTPKNERYHIYLCAASHANASAPLRRSVLLKSVIENNSYPAPEGVTTPYVGVFHRGNQKGERIITWNDQTNWTAVIETDPYLDENNNSYNDYQHVLIDRQISPAMEAGILYTENPGDAEDYPVSQWSDDMGGVLNGRRWISGSSKVYLRVGWDSYAPGAPFRGTQSGADIPNGAGYRNRYAKMTIRRGANAPNGPIISTLYLRQGELADYIMRPYGDKYIAAANGSGALWSISPNGDYSVYGNYPIEDYREHACRIPPYNLSDPNKGSGGSQNWNHNLLPARGATFTEFPTQAGYLFKFSESLRAYNPEVPAKGEIKDFTTDYQTKEDWNPATMEVSPPGYKRPSEHYTQGSTKYDYTQSEFTHTLYEQPAANKLVNDGNAIDYSGLINSKRGWYADGFFDRRKVVQLDTPFGVKGNADTKVSSGGTVAYYGTMFYNKQTNTSIFFPHTGERMIGFSGMKGELVWPGRSAMYWSDSQFEDSDASARYAWALDFWINSPERCAVTNQGDKSRAVPIRCVVETIITKK